jgi:hypothetical protein
LVRIAERGCRERQEHRPHSRERTLELRARPMSGVAQRMWSASASGRPPPGYVPIADYAAIGGGRTVALTHWPVSRLVAGDLVVDAFDARAQPGESDQVGRGPLDSAERTTYV